jgi:hypothetical protein
MLLIIHDQSPPIPDLGLDPQNRIGRAKVRNDNLCAIEKDDDD